MELKPMIVRDRPNHWNRHAATHEETISVEQQEAALNSLRRGDDPFTNKDIQAALRKQGVGEAAYRGADRLLQKLRKQGVIQFHAGFWTFLK